MKARLSLCTLPVALLFAAQAATGETVSQTRFVGFSNLTSTTASCVAPSSSPSDPAGTCGTSQDKYALQAGGNLFNRFDTSLGTLNGISFSYNIEAGGIWIGRPEDSVFSDSTDFAFASRLSLSFPEFGTFYDLEFPIRIDNDFTRTTLNNVRIDSEAVGWAVALNGTTNLDQYTGNVLFTPGITLPKFRDDLALAVVFHLNASLDGNSLDCQLGTASCGVTNRIEYLRQARFTLTYDYSPTSNVVPIPGAMLLFASALAGLGFAYRKTSAGTTASQALARQNKNSNMST